MGALACDEGQYAARQRADVPGRIHDSVELDAGTVSPAEVGEKALWTLHYKVLDSEPAIC